MNDADDEVDVENKFEVVIDDRRLEVWQDPENENWYVEGCSDPVTTVAQLFAWISED